MMKKAFAISLSILMLTAMLHFSVARHYCGGKIAASIISLSGKLASCGMQENKMDYPLTGTYFNSHCCDNVVVIYGIDNNYFPSFSFTPESCQYNFQILCINAGLAINPFAELKSIYTSVSPPDDLLSTIVDLSDICVFRI